MFPGEKTSPTQPFPYKPEPLARIDFAMKDIATVTPALEAGCRKLIADNNIQVGARPVCAAHLQPLTPAVISSRQRNRRRGLGAASSFNPKLGYLFINATVTLGCQLNGVKDPASGPVNLTTLPGSNERGGRTGPYANGGPGGRFRDATTGMFCSQPPWGELVAVNVNTGDIAWRVPLGITDSLPADKQNTGRPSQGGSIATASGLVFIGAADDNRFRAFDAKTGKELWATKLNASAGVGAIHLSG